MRLRASRLWAIILVLSFPFLAMGQDAEKKGNRRTTKPQQERVSVEKKRINGGSLQTVGRFKSKDYESERVLHDFDGDGWCDIWCSMFKNQIEHRSTKIDTDGDGLTDYEEMILMRDPVNAGPMPRKLTAAEIAEGKKNVELAKKRAAKEHARVRKMLEPFMHEDAVDEKGNPIGVDQKRAEKRQRLSARLQQLEQFEKAEKANGKAMVEQSGLSKTFELPSGGVAVLSGAGKGLPDYFHSRSSLVSADSISVDNLWPGGSSGFDLTGKSTDSPPVTLGVWEPRGLVVDHPEFTTAIETIDSTDSTSGWAATGGGFYAFNGNAPQCQEGNGCLDLRRPGGQASTLYFRQQPASYDFTDRTVAVWYYFGDVNFLATDPAVEIRFGSSATNYWQRSFKRENLQNGWNLLSMKSDTATSVVGSPTLTACSYTALNVTYSNPAFPLNADGQGMDYWRLSDTRIQNMDRASSVEDHSTHTTGLMISSGVNPDAKGMAFEANIHTRDALNHLTEMGEIFTNADASDNIFTSNHSYGPNPGWTRQGVNVATNFLVVNGNGQQTGVQQLPAGVYLAWAGNATISPTEDIAFGRYTDALSAQIDANIYGSDSLLPVWAAGNDRGDQTTGGHLEFDFTRGQIVISTANRPADGGASGFDSMPADSVAKNILTVGSVQDVPGGFNSGSNVQMSTFSSFGPTDDGRIKPDICANGDGVLSAAYDDPADNTDSPYVNFSGTSEAAPTLAGAIGLVVDLVRRYRGDSYEPPASLLKALMIHTADDILNAGPDYKSGFGLANGESAVNLVNQNEATHQGQNVRMVVIPNGGSVSIPVVATGGEPLKVTVVSTDPAGIEPPEVLDIDTPMLVNDFSLSVNRNGSTFFPFSLNKNNPNALATKTGPNSVDNVEQVLIDNPAAGGDYNIVLAPAAGETFVDDIGNPTSQEVALIISGIDPDPSLELVITSVMQTGADKFTLVWPALIGSSYRVQESPDLGTNSFTDITGDIVAEMNFIAREVTGDPTTISKKFWRVRKVE